ncbi:MAG: dihydrodipicolinate synthase family protein [Firmicutes bacterium]|nr:dihydrodipicolinate synthase family protein [Bacillota bacterium]
MRLCGAIPPMITPFGKDGSLDEQAVASVASFLAKYVHGLFICGTYGGGPLMTVAERKRVCELTIKAVEGKIPVIAHIGTMDTASALELATHAEKAGAKAVASIPPAYFAHNEDNVLHYFKSLVDAIDIPVYLYNNPKTVGYAISPKFLAKIAEEAHISGVKDSSFDIMVFSDYKRYCGPEFDVVLGTEALLLPAMAVGAQAFIPGLGNAFPKLMADFYQVCAQGNTLEARAFQHKVNRIRDAVHLGGANLVTVQELLRLQGVNAGWPRLPFRPLTPDKLAKVQTALEQCEIWPA